MGSGSSGAQQQRPGTLSPVFASLLSLFGGQPEVRGDQFVPTSFGGPGAAFTPQSFGALPGLLQNQPLTGTESAILGAQGGGFGGGIQPLAAQAALQSQGLLQQGAGALSQALQGPEAAIALARRGFTEETVPSILERAPGFSSSDLQRELTRAGTDLETGVAALREQNLTQNLALTPTYAQALGSNLLDQAAQVLGFGTLGREFVREASPAGDAFRVLTALQSLTGPATSTSSFGRNKSTGVIS